MSGEQICSKITSNLSAINEHIHRAAQVRRFKRLDLPQSPAQTPKLVEANKIVVPAVLHTTAAHEYQISRTEDGQQPLPKKKSFSRGGFLQTPKLDLKTNLNLDRQHKMREQPESQHRPAEQLKGSSRSKKIVQPTESDINDSLFIQNQDNIRKTQTFKNRQQFVVDKDSFPIDVMDVCAPSNTSQPQALLLFFKEVLARFGVQVKQPFLKKYRNCLVFGSNSLRLVKYDDGRLFLGRMNDTKKEGKGAEWKKPVYFVGEWVDGRRQGRGVEVDVDSGSSYTGQWKGGVRHGHGVETGKQSRYQGGFMFGSKHGLGVQEFKDGSVYKGSYVNGEFHGLGELTIGKEKKCLRGQFCEGRFTGDRVAPVTHRAASLSERVEKQAQMQNTPSVVTKRLTSNTSNGTWQSIRSGSNDSVKMRSRVIETRRQKNGAGGRVNRDYEVKAYDHYQQEESQDDSNIGLLLERNRQRRMQQPREQPREQGKAQSNGSAQSRRHKLLEVYFTKKIKNLDLSFDEPLQKRNFRK